MRASSILGAVLPEVFTARCSGVSLLVRLPFTLALTSAPAAMRASTTLGAVSPEVSTARCSGVFLPKPPFTLALTSAPAAMRAPTTSGFPFDRIASCSGPSPCPSRVSRSAPAVTRTSTMFRPDAAESRLAAKWSGVAPDSVAASTSAPAATRASIVAGSPARTASCSGVSPLLLRALTSAPPATRVSITRAFPGNKCEAWCNGVFPYRSREPRPRPARARASSRRSPLRPSSVEMSCGSLLDCVVMESLAMERWPAVGGCREDGSARPVRSPMPCFGNRHGSGRVRQNRSWTATGRGDGSASENSRARRTSSGRAARRPRTAGGGAPRVRGGASGLRGGHGIAPNRPGSSSISCDRGTGVGRRPRHRRRRAAETRRTGHPESGPAPPPVLSTGAGGVTPPGFARAAVGREKRVP